MTLSKEDGGGLLLLEDDKGTCELEAQRLEALGLEIRKCHSVEDALAALRTATPELMLLDYSLPGTNALDFIESVRKTGPALPPFLMVTGRGDEAVAVAAMKAGACDYLVKNNDFLENLLPAVTKALEKIALLRELEAAQKSTARNLHLYTFLAQVNLAASQTKDRQALYRQICEVAVNSGGLRMAWIGLLDEDLGRIIPFCQAGAVGDFLDGLRVDVSGEGGGALGKAARSRKIQACSEVAKDSKISPLKEKMLARGYNSAAAMPLEENGRLVGLLLLYSEEPGFFSGPELKLLEEIRADISLALDAIASEEKRVAAQAALERTSSQLAHIMDVTPVMLFKVRLAEGGEPVIDWVSGNSAEVTGYSPEEVLRPGWLLEYRHPEDRPAAVEGLKEILVKKKLVRDFRFRHKNGRYFWVHAQLTLSEKEKREITGSWTDITQLKESEERFQELFEKAPLGYQSLDEAGRFLDVNQAWLDALGYAREEVIGRWFGDFLAPEYVEAFKEHFPQFKAAGRVHSEFELLRKSGDRRFMAFDGRIARARDGAFQRTHCILKDITEAKLAESRLRNSEAKFRTLFECGNDAMFMHPLGTDGEAGNFTEVNGVACERLGYTREELLRLGPADIDAGEMAPVRAAALRRLATEGRALFETKHRSKDGRVIEVEISARSFDHYGKHYVLAVARDTTERKKAQAEKLLLSEVLKASLNEIYIFDDRTLRFRFLNKGAVENTGYTAEEASLLTPLALKPQLTPAEFEGLLAPLRSGASRVQFFETTHKRKDGSTYPVEVHLQHEPENGVFVAIISDISRRVGAERELREKNSLLQLAGRAAKFGAWSVDLEKGVCTWSDEVAAIHEEPAGHSPLLEDGLNYYAPEWREKIGEVFGACARDGAPYDEEMEIITACGNRRWVRAIGQAERGKDGRVVRVFGAFQDITQSKTAEEKLRQSEQLRRAILDNLPIGVSVNSVSPEVVFTYMNDNFTRFYRVKPEELAKPDSFWEAVYKDPGERETMRARVLGDIASGDPERMHWEDVPLRRDGKTYYISAKGIPLPEKGLIISTVWDVTDRRVAELALKESEETFRRLVEHSPYGIFIQLEGKFEYFNPEALRLFRARSAAELAGRPIFEVFRGDSHKGIEERLRTLQGKHERVPEVEEVCLRLDGTEFPALVSAVPFELGQRRGAIVTLQDITQKKQMEEDLLRSQKIESLGVLAGGIAHDFNNMLTGIMANLSLLSVRTGGGEDADIIRDTLEAARSAQTLTTHLLSFSKGGKPVKKEFCLARSLADIFTLATRGAKASHDLRTQEGLWSVEGDEGQIKQAVNNLLLNALQAMPSGGTVTLAAENTELSAEGSPLPPGKYVRVTVSDTGIGIPKEYLARVFEPYFTTKTQGHGLGLSMTWSVVKSHGGHITAASESGKGTQFELLLPATGRRMNAQPAQGREIAKGSGRVLLLEDEDIVIRAAKRMMAELGYECAVTQDGVETLKLYDAEAAAGRPFDAVIMDLTIPGGMGGKEAGAELRRRHPEAVIIVSSGYSDEPVMADYKAFGFDAVLPKPYRYEDLAETLARLLVKNKAT